MGDTHSRRKPDRSAAASAKTAKDIVKAAACEKKVQSKRADASRTLRAALDALTEARSGSSGEEKARKAARAAVDVLVTAKRKLAKAQRKLRKAAAKQVKWKARAEGTATAKPKSGPNVGSSKSRKASAPLPTTKPDVKKVEGRSVAKAAAKTSTDSVVSGMQPDEAARVDF